MQYNIEDGSAGGAVTLALIFIAGGFLVAILGVPVDVFIQTHNAMIGTTLPVSQDSINTGSNLTIGFRALAFCLLMAVGINYLNNAQRELSGEA